MLISEVVRHRIYNRGKKEKGEERRCFERVMMLDAIYAWRRKRRDGGSPKSERSDAIMDLRAGSRNSKFPQLDLLNDRSLSRFQPPPLSTHSFKISFDNPPTP